MTNEEFRAIYEEKLRELKAECRQMVEDGELSEEDAAFRYEIVKDEILWMMDDPYVKGVYI